MNYNLQWFTVGTDTVQARNYSGAKRIVKDLKAFEEKQKGKKNGKEND